MLNLQNTNNPHDTFCKKIFEHPDLALAFILDHIPELRNQIIGPPEVISGTLIDNETRRVLYCDCVWKLKLKPKPGKPTHTHIILEHKSSPDSKVGIQLSKYTSTFAERLANEDSNTVQQSPEIIPMVLYHGKGKWDLPEVYKTSSNRGEKAWGTTTHLIYINLSTLPRDKLSSNPSLHAAFYTMLFSTGALGKGDKAPPMEKVIKMIFKNS
ncbi:MAG: Rpn family recombination-promoting nuclease/putative transposase, partial [Gammaproteobacteria bacterium]